MENDGFLLPVEINSSPDICSLVIIECEFKRVVDAGAGGDLGLHGDVGDAGGGEAGEHVVQRDKGSLGGRHDALAAALPPHVDAAVLGDGGGDVVVVGGRHLHDAAQVLAHLGGGAGIGLVPRAELNECNIVECAFQHGI